MTVLELCTLEVDYDKHGTSIADKLETYRIMKGLCSEGLAYAKAKGSDFVCKEICDTFLDKDDFATLCSKIEKEAEICGKKEVPAADLSSLLKGGAAPAPEVKAEPKTEAPAPTAVPAKKESSDEESEEESSEEEKKPAAAAPKPAAKKEESSDDEYESSSEEN